MEVKIIIEYKKEYVEAVEKELRLNTSEGIRGFFIGNFVQYANKMDGVESVCVKVFDDKELSEENNSLKETAKEIEKETAREIFEYIAKSGVINVAPDTIKMFFKERYGVEVCDEK